MGIDFILKGSMYNLCTSIMKVPPLVLKSSSHFYMFKILVNTLSYVKVENKNMDMCDWLYTLSSKFACKCTHVIHLNPTFYYDKI